MGNQAVATNPQGNVESLRMMGDRFCGTISNSEFHLTCLPDIFSSNFIEQQYYSR
jgi:hypothetical protein